jgi:hypothetical protein
MEKARQYLKPIAYTLGASTMVYFMYLFYKRCVKNRLSLMFGDNNPIPLDKNEALRRASLIQNLKYNLFLQLKEFPILQFRKTYDGAISVQFDMNAVEDIFLDFNGIVLNVTVNNKEIPINHRNNRIHLPKQNLKNYGNEVYLRFENTYSNLDQGIKYFSDPDDTVSLSNFL